MATVASSTNLPPPGSPSASPKAHVGAVLRRWSTRLGLGSSPSLDSRPQPAAAVPADRAAQSTLSPPGPAASASPPPAKPPPHLRPLNEAQRSATYPDVAKCNGWSRVEYNIHVAPPRDIWVDCDPGHDDALALLVATHHPGLRLVGVSTVSGNTSGRAVYINAARILVAIGADQVLRKQSQHSAEATAEDAHDGTKHALDDSAVQPILLRGADAPLLQPVRRATSMHSDDGLKGVAGLPALDDPDLAKRLWASYDGTQSPEHLVHGAQTGDSQPAGPTLAVPPASPARVVSALAADLLRRRQAGGPPLHVCVTGPCTNLALLIKMHPELVAPDTVASIVIMAGTAESKQDESSGTEFNAAGDPEALAIVFNHPVRVVMMGLNVTHQAIFTPEVHDRLLQLSPAPPPKAMKGPSNVRKLVSSAMTFFASAYAHDRGFKFGPPVHDLLTVVYVADPQLFFTARLPISPPAETEDLASGHVRAQDEHAKRKERGEDQMNEPDLSSDVEQLPAATAPEADASVSGAPVTSADKPISYAEASRTCAPLFYRVQVDTGHGVGAGTVTVDSSSASASAAPLTLALPAGPESEEAVPAVIEGHEGPDVLVLEQVDMPGLWELFLDVMDCADKALP